MGSGVKPQSRGSGGEAPSDFIEKTPFWAFFAKTAVVCRQCQL